MAGRTQALSAAQGLCWCYSQLGLCGGEHCSLSIASTYYNQHPLIIISIH